MKPRSRRGSPEVLQPKPSFVAEGTITWITVLPRSLMETK
jgi:hypothetical protein